MAVTGNEAGGPVKVGAPVLDIGSGMSAATAIIAALFARTADGLGRTVSSSLLEFALGCFTSYAADMLETGTSPGLLGNDSPQFAPYGVFRCRTGPWRWPARAASRSGSSCATYSGGRTGPPTPVSPPTRTGWRTAPS